MSGATAFERRDLWFLLASAFAFCLWLILIAPVFGYHFSSADYSLIVEDYFRNPWYRSVDHVYRPLRNGFLRIMMAMFGLNPAPYHAVALTEFLVCLGLLFVLVRRLGGEIWGALTAVIIIGIYPRNFAFLFGFNWSQELVVAQGMLAAALGWYQFRRHGSRLGYGIAVAGFALALGFKETAVVLPALLLVVDFYILKDPWRQALFRRSFWLPYAGLLPVVLTFGVFVLSQREGAILAPDPTSSYKYSSLSGAVLGVARAIVNLLMPFSLLALRDLKIWHYGLLVLELGAIAWVAWWTDTIRPWLMACAWVLLTVAPPSLFNRPVNSARYYFLPMLGVAFAVAMTVDALVKRRPGTAPLFALVLIAYSVGSAQQLAVARTDWRTAGELIQSFLAEMPAVVPPAEARSLIFVNVPQDHGQASIFNNGLRGALISAGYPNQMRLEANLVGESPEAGQGALIQKILACPAGPVQNPHRDLVWIDNRIVDRTGTCADDAIKQDQQRRPWVWYEL